MAPDEQTYPCPREKCSGTLRVYTGTIGGSMRLIVFPSDVEERPQIIEPDEDRYEPGMPYQCDRCTRVYQSAVYRFER